MPRVNVTINDIASRTGVSKSTVSRVLRNDPHVSNRARELVLACAKELNYEPNYFAQGLKTQHSGTIAYFIPSIEIMIYPAIVRAVEKAAMERGYTLLLCDILEDKNIARDYVRKLLSRNVDGFIFSTALDKSELDIEINEALSSGIPCLNLLRSSDHEMDAIVSDNLKGAKLAVEFLISKGKKRIAYLQGQTELRLYRTRLEGYRQQLKESGIDVDESLIWNGYENFEKVAIEKVITNIKNGIVPDAIFCASDHLSLDALYAVTELGLKVPEDIAIIGFDNLPITEMMNPRLTTVAQPFSEMGKAAVDRIIDMIEGKVSSKNQDYVYEPKLIIRNSV